jgi:hypothetical protein
MDNFHLVRSPWWQTFEVKFLLLGVRAIIWVSVLATLWFILPPEERVNRGGRIDWIGASIGMIGLIALNIAWKYVFSFLGSNYFW